MEILNSLQDVLTSVNSLDLSNRVSILDRSIDSYFCSEGFYSSDEYQSTCIRYFLDKNESLKQRRLIIKDVFIEIFDSTLCSVFSTANFCDLHDSIDSLFKELGYEYNPDDVLNTALSGLSIRYDGVALTININFSKHINLLQKDNHLLGIDNFSIDELSNIYFMRYS